MKKEQKKNKMIIFLIIISVILVPILLSFLKSCITNKIAKLNDEKVVKAINELKEEKINYVFVKINPQMVFSIKNNKIVNVGCLNEDCLTIYESINILDKDIKSGIQLVYNVTKEKGYKINNGVSVKCSEDLELDFGNLDYIHQERIDKKEEDKLLNNVLNNDKIKEKTEFEDYNIKLWNEYKQDKDYGKFYECHINNKELECYIKKDLALALSDDENNSLTSIISNANKVLPNIQGIARVLKKFNFNIEGTVELGLFEIPNKYLNYNGTKYRIFGNIKSQKSYYYARVKCNDYHIYLTDINLLKPNDIKPQIPQGNGFVPFNEISESSSVICGGKDCKIIVYYAKNICNEETGIGEQVGDYYIGRYEICDKNRENCREVTKEYYDYYIPDIGYIMDFEYCDPSNPGKYKRPTTKGQVCRYKDSDGRWTYDFAI